MAVESVCSKLKGGQDNSCSSPLRRYYQQAVIINKSDILSYTITKTSGTGDSAVCAYNVSFTLKEGATGYLFKGNENGSIYMGTFDKAKNETFATPEYMHHAQIIVTGVSEASKCILESLDSGNFVVAYQFADGTVEVYGMEYGLSTEDYTYDVQTNGGGTTIIMGSVDTKPERYMPLVYKSTPSGSETEDFDSLFANPVTP